MEAGFVADGKVHVPKGARSGLASQPSEQLRRLRNGELETLEQCSIVWVEDGETLVSVAQGGGGYGDPSTRDIDRVVHDVREKLISRARAEEVYKVSINEEGRVDKEQTSRLRSA